jgi:hypothetical protein
MSAPLLTSVTLKRIGRPPGRTVVLPCAAMVTSMLPAGLSTPGLGACGTAEVTAGRLDVEAGWPVVVVPELVGVPGWEQPTTAAIVAPAIIVATTVIRLFMTICVFLL